MIWVLIHTSSLILLEITIGVLVIVWLKRKVYAGIQQHIGLEHTGLLVRNILM